MITIRHTIICSIVLLGGFLMGNSGCEDYRYERKILEESGPVGVSFWEEDEEECNVVLNFDVPVWKVDVRNSGSFYETAKCKDKENCLSFLHVCVGCQHEPPVIYDQPASYEDRTVIANVTGSFDELDNDTAQECNAEFTVTVWTKDGEKSTFRYFQFADYYEEGWL